MDSENEPGAYTEEELEKLKKIEQLLDEAKATSFAGPTESENEAKLRAIQEQAKKAKQTFDKHKPEAQNSQFVGSGNGRNLGLGLQIAYAIIGVPLVGYGVGWLIDNQVGGKLWSGLLTILGATAAIWYAVKSANRS